MKRFIKVVIIFIGMVSVIATIAGIIMFLNGNLQYVDPNNNIYPEEPLEYNKKLPDYCLTIKHSFKTTANGLDYEYKIGIDVIMTEVNGHRVKPLRVAIRSIVLDDLQKKFGSTNRSSEFPGDFTLTENKIKEHLSNKLIATEVKICIVDLEKNEEIRYISGSFRPEK